MIRVGVMVSGGGTNLQAILDAVDAGKITNASIEVVISNKKDAYALERAKNHGIEAVAVIREQQMHDAPLSHLIYCGHGALHLIEHHAVIGQILAVNLVVPALLAEDIGIL